METDANTMTRVNSFRFRKMSDEFDNTKFLSIIFQRVGKFKYLKVIMRGNRGEKNKGGEGDEDVIVVKHMDKLKPSDISTFFGNKDVESGAVIDLELIKDVPEVTDKEFRIACNKGSRRSYGFARTFLFMELLSKFVELFLLFVIPLYAVYKFKETEITVVLCIFIPIILLQVICDWTKLSEKYSKLCFDFANLANSKDAKRIEKYQSLVVLYRGGLIHSDMIADIDI